MKIFLIGFMGSGKTTLGKQLAAELGCRFIDQDSAIEKAEKMSITEIFSLKGEAKFREIERLTLAELALRDNIVVATGGGAPCFFDNAETMKKSGISIYLKVSPQTLFNRLRVANAHRPLISAKSDQELLAFITTKLAEREVYYRQSTITIECNDIRCSDIIHAINQHLKK